MNTSDNGCRPPGGASLNKHALSAPVSSTPKPSRLALGRTGLPRRAHARILQFRAVLEQLVTEAHGQIDALAAKRIASATVALTEAERARIRLADAAAGKITLSEGELQGWSDRHARHHAACDRLLDRLGFDVKAVDPWDAIYAAPRQLPASPTGSPTPPANAGPSDAPTTER